MNVIWWKKIHNILGIASAFFLTILLVTGICLNHPARFERKDMEAIALDPSDTSRIFSGGKDGLSVSKDGGAQWEEVPMLFPPQDVVDLVFASKDPRRIYALEKWGRLYVSHDGGKVWTALALPFDPQLTGVELKRIVPGAGGDLALLTSRGWLRSGDGGKTWDPSHFIPGRRSAMETIKALHNGYFFSPQFVWVYDASAAALLILIVTGFVLWKTGRKIG